MTDLGDRLAGQGRLMKDSQDFLLGQVSGLYDLEREREPPPHLSDKLTGHATHSLPCLHQKRRNKMHLTYVRGKRSHLGNEGPCISDYTD